jgi:hypothetical protein
MTMPPQGWNAPQDAGPRYQPTAQFPPAPAGSYGNGAPGQAGPYGAGGQPPYGMAPRPDRTPWIVGGAILAVAAIALVLAFTVFKPDQKDGAKNQGGSPKQAVQSLLNAVRAHDLDGALKVTTGSARDLLTQLKRGGGKLDTVAGAPIGDISFAIGEPQMDGDTARVPVSGTYQGQSQSTIIRTQKVDGVWLVSHLGLLQGDEPVDSPTDEPTGTRPAPSESETAPSDGNTSGSESSDGDTSDGDSAAVTQAVDVFFRAVLNDDYDAALRDSTGAAHEAVARAQAENIPLAGRGDQRIERGSMGPVLVNGDTATLTVRLEYAGAEPRSSTVTCSRVDGAWKVSDLGDFAN